MVGDPDVDIVVEVIGGIEPARTLIVEALMGGKPVVTANKELIATHGRELFETAEGAGVDILFEASVGGGIPLIRPLRESLAGDRIRRVMGIVNGTTNYILTNMTDAGASFADALAEAQALGLRRGRSDRRRRRVRRRGEGRDHRVDRVRRARGRRRRVPRGHHRDHARRHRVGTRPRLRREAARGGGGVRRRGRGARASRDGPVRHPLASVRDSFNAVFIEGDAVGELMLYGRGAGGGPTASAVLGDLVDAAKNLVEGRKGATMGTLAPKPIRAIDDVESQFYLMMEVPDRPVCSRAIATEFEQFGVSIRSMQQRDKGDEARLIFVTHKARESDLRDTVRALRDVEQVHRVGAVLRGDGGERRVGASRRRGPALIEARTASTCPVTDATPVITLLEGNTPLLDAPRVAQRAGIARVYLKVEGLNPTGSFKDRGMTMAISIAVERDAKVVICASTGNTSASAAAYAARAGLLCAVVIPEGQIALGKLAQALIHGARVVPVHGTFDRGARDRARAGGAARRRGRQLGEPGAHRGPEDGLVRDRRRAGRRPDRALDPGRQRRQHHRLLAGLLRVRASSGAPTRTPRMLGLAGRGCGAARARRAGARIPRRSPPRSRSATRRRGRARSTRATSRAGTSARSPTRRSSRPTACSRPTKGCFVEPASAASVAGLLQAVGRRPARGRRRRGVHRHRPRAQGPEPRHRRGAGRRSGRRRRGDRRRRALDLA